MGTTSPPTLALFYGRATGLHCKSVDLRYAPEKQAYTTLHLRPSPLMSKMYQRTGTLKLAVRPGERLVMEVTCHRPGMAGTEKQRFDTVIRGDETLLMFVAEKRMTLKLLSPSSTGS